MNKIHSLVTAHIEGTRPKKSARAKFYSSLLLGGLLLGGLGLSGCAVAYPNGYADGYESRGSVIVGVDYGRRGPPPPPPYEVIGIAPFFGAIWMPGQWIWRDRWVWHRGYWGGRPAGPRYYEEPGYYNGPGWGYAPPPRYPGYGYYRWGDDRGRHHDRDDRREYDRGHHHHHDDDD
ncbi:MAG: hypothetical protein ACP5Q0_06920 [Halothiobacillus sp.]